MSLANLAALRASLAAQLQLRNMDRSREQQRLQALQNVGQQGIGALQSAIQAGANASNAAEERKLARERLAQQMSLQTRRLDLDEQRHQDSMALRREEQRRFLMGGAPGSGNAAVSPAEQRKTLKESLDRSRAGLAGSVESKVDGQLEVGPNPLPNEQLDMNAARDILTSLPYGQALSTPEIAGELEMSRRENAEESRKEAKTVAERVRAERTADKPVMPADRLGRARGDQDELHSLSKVRELATNKNIQWDKMRELLDETQRMGLPPSATVAIGGGVSIGASGLSVGADGGANASGSKGGIDVAALAEAQRFAKRLGLNRDTRRLMATALSEERRLAAQKERLTDADWRFYERNGLSTALLEGRDAFADRFNDRAQLTFRRFSDVVEDNSEFFNINRSLVRDLESFDPSAMLLAEDFVGEVAPISPLSSDDLARELDSTSEVRARLPAAVRSLSGEAGRQFKRAAAKSKVAAKESFTFDNEGVEGLSDFLSAALRGDDPLTSDDRRFGVEPERRKKAAGVLRSLAGNPRVDIGTANKFRSYADAIASDRVAPAGVDRIISRAEAFLANQNRRSGRRTR